MVTLGSGWPVEAADGWTITTRDRGLAAHYEDTIVITQGRPMVLTGAAA
jgi:methionyl aminopeptidase